MQETAAKREKKDEYRAAGQEWLEKNLRLQKNSKKNRKQQQFIDNKKEKRAEKNGNISKKWQIAQTIFDKKKQKNKKIIEKVTRKHKKYRKKVIKNKIIEKREKYAWTEQ